MKLFKIIIAFAVIYVFLSIIGLLALSSWWLSTFWANSYERPIGQIYVTSKNNTYETTSAQVIFYKNDSALTTLFTRDVSQPPKDQDVVLDIPFNSDNLTIDFYNVELSENLRASGFTHLYKVQRVKTSNNKQYYENNDSFLEVMYLNQNSFKYWFTALVPLSLSIDHSSNNAKYDIIASPDGLSLRKIE